MTVGVFLLLGGIDPDRVSLYCFGTEREEQNGRDGRVHPRLV